MICSYLVVRDITEYQEWTYETDCGVPLFWPLVPVGR